MSEHNDEDIEFACDGFSRHINLLKSLPENKKQEYGQRLMKLKNKFKAEYATDPIRKVVLDRNPELVKRIFSNSY
jgi:hypothetical protein